jgi:V8-like Glu-specific endopeptidase
LPYKNFYEGSIMHTTKSSTLKWASAPRLGQVLFCLATAAVAAPAAALTNATVTTTDFTNLGTLGGANGVLVAPNWVLTAAHVAGNSSALIGTSFQSADGSATVDAAYVFDGSSNFPDNDIALVHLSSAISSGALPTLNDSATNEAMVYFGGDVTLASAQSAGQRSYGFANGLGGTTTYTDPNTSVTSTVNWILTAGATNTEGGDSGSALYLGQVTDGTGQVLMGIASADGNYLGSSFSAYVDVSAYKDWINQTIAGSGLSGSTQTVRWLSAVPESSTFALMSFGLGCMGLAAARRRRPS